MKCMDVGTYHTYIRIPTSYSSCCESPDKNQTDGGSDCQVTSRPRMLVSEPGSASVSGFNYSDSASSIRQKEHVAAEKALK